MESSSREESRPLLAARIRVARAWADLSQVRLAQELDLSVQTIKRIELGRRDVSTDELLTIARVCRVPERFMLRGFANHDEAPPGQQDRYELDVTDELSLVNSRLDDQAKMLARMLRKVDLITERLTEETA